MIDIDGYGPDELRKQILVSGETISALEKIIATLNEWRKSSNLIGPTEWDHIWRRHVLDSLQICPHIAEGADVVDLGSGAGFPGLMIAADRIGAGSTVTMIESVGKKSAFLRAASRAAGLKTVIRNERVEAVSDVSAACVSARAFAPLPKLLEYSEPWLIKGAKAVFLKGRRWEEELTLAAKTWTFAHEAIPSVTSPDGVVLKLSEVRRVP